MDSMAVDSPVTLRQRFMADLVLLPLPDLRVVLVRLLRDMAVLPDWRRIGREAFLLLTG